MKRIITYLAISISVLSYTAEAQIQRGNVLIGADLANINLSLDKGGNFSFRINPKVAWFIRDNVAVGGYVLAGLSTAKNAGTNVQYGVGALARYYLGASDVTLLRHSRLFVEGNAGIEGDNPAVGDNTNGLGLGVGPGIAYFITPNIGLEALLKYNGIVGFGTAPTSNELNFSLGFQIYLSGARARSIRDEIKNP
jgi:outer membrane protein with beta-barrel domain